MHRAHREHARTRRWGWAEERSLFGVADCQSEVLGDVFGLRAVFRARQDRAVAGFQAAVRALSRGGELVVGADTGMFLWENAQGQPLRATLKQVTAFGAGLDYSAQIGPVTEAQRPGATKRLYRHLSGSVPDGTRMVKVVLAMQGPDRSDNDGLVMAFPWCCLVPEASGRAQLRHAMSTSGHVPVIHLSTAKPVGARAG